MYTFSIQRDVPNLCINVFITQRESKTKIVPPQKRTSGEVDLGKKPIFSSTSQSYLRRQMWGIFAPLRLISRFQPSYKTNFRRPNFTTLLTLSRPPQTTNPFLNQQMPSWNISTCLSVLFIEIESDIFDLSCTWTDRRAGKTCGNCFILSALGYGALQCIFGNCLKLKANMLEPVNRTCHIFGAYCKTQFWFWPNQTTLRKTLEYTDGAGYLCTHSGVRSIQKQQLLIVPTLNSIFNKCNKYKSIKIIAFHKNKYVSLIGLTHFLKIVLYELS